VKDNNKKVKFSIENIEKEMRNMNIKMEGYRTDNAEGQERIKDDFRDRIQDLDKYYSDALEEMTTNLEQVRHLAKN
jgi:predicted  nucleic acid-binding Zn-ribbon protein